MKFSIIAAVEKNFGIGKNNAMPWYLPNELKYFSQKTIGRGKNAVITGRKNWESLPEKSRPLKRRVNIVLTRDTGYALPEGVLRASSLDEALKKAESLACDEIFVIGGGAVFAEALEHPACSDVYLTQLEVSFPCDVFFPKIDSTKFSLVEESHQIEEKTVPYRFLHFRKASF